MSSNFIFEIYKDSRTVFTLKEIALLLNVPELKRLKQRIHYYVQTNKLRNPRKGIYVKEDYLSEELACKVNSPSYISLEYVLQKAGIIFQYSTNITLVSYLSRTIDIDGHFLVYRKIKNPVLYNAVGINRGKNGINIASPERAFLDTNYLNKNFHFDSLLGLNRESIMKMLVLYQSKELEKRVLKMFKNA
ncbi:MAG: hypothetical protein JXC36_07395 [Candidatus Atribacteria bacterium]|nr:hypothetical protein [Candidatus Atribacteria bacterium]